MNQRLTFKSLAVVASGVLLTTSAVQPQDAVSQPRKEGGIVVTLTDGSTVSGMLDIKSLEVDTAYGKLKVPVADILQIRIGTKSMPALKKRIDALIADLGDNSFDQRENASEQLAKLGALAAAALQDATKSNDAEVVTRAKKLLEQLGFPDELPPQDDELETKLFPIRGTAKFDALSIVTERGAVKVEKKSIVSLTAGDGDSLPSLADGLVAHWKFDEKDGDTVHDSGPNKLHGKLQEYAEGDSRWAQGRVGGALQFNGATNYVTVPNSEQALNPGKQDWTICAWLKTSRTDGGNASVVVGKQGEQGRALVMGVVLKGYIEEAHRCAFFEASGADYTKVVYGTTNVTDGKWHHLAGVRVKGELKIYVDGRLHSSMTDPSVAEDFASSGPLELGRHKLWDGWACPRFEGLMDDLRIYQRALTKKEIEFLANAGR